MLHVRVDDAVKDQAAQAFERMGLTMSEGVRVFLRRVAADQARVMGARFETGAELMDDLSGNHG